MAEEVSNKSLYILVILIVALVVINAILIASTVTGSAVKNKTEVKEKVGSGGATLGASVQVYVLPKEGNTSEVNKNG